MKKMRVLIYEKNEKEAEKFESYISNKVRVTEFYKCYNVKDALYFTMMTDIDLFVVNACSETEDRYTPKGIEFIEFIRKHEKTKFTPVIVTSKLYDENDSIINELCCNAYILKPMDLQCNEDQIDYCISLAEYIYEKRNYSPGILFLKDGDDIRVVNEKNILWVEKHSHCIVFHGRNEEIKVDRRSTEYVIKKLDKKRFYSVGRSDIINIVRVKQIKGNVVIFDRGEKSLCIGKEAAMKFRAYLQEKKWIS